MATPVVVFEHVWKKFRRGEHHDSLRDLIPSLVRRGLARQDDLRAEEFWALRDVSFQVRAGQALGIIGPNGAGKSTTLKLLTRILGPTRGRSEVRGRVGALIEVAAGFHQDLTGRENIYLQGAIMGMRRAEIGRKLEAIVDFAGVRDFIDTPVKRYSSGMNARLGFSIAAHLEPDVLVIDEVLSVGDMTFQQRCTDRMREFKERGVAIVFVSHNLQAVATLCDDALFLEREVRAYGPAEQVVERYVRSMGERQRPASHDEEVHVESVRLVDAAGQPVGAVSPGTGLTLRLRLMPRVRAHEVVFTFEARRSTDDLVVYEGNFSNVEMGLGQLEPGRALDADFRFRANLARGQYHLVVTLTHTPTRRDLAKLAPAAVFAVHETRTRSGTADLEVAPIVSVREDREAEALAGRIPA